MTIEDDYAKLPGTIVKSNFDNGKLSFKDYFSTPPMFFTKNRENVPFINRFNGSCGFLIAGGPSFKDIDHSKLALPGVLTMGINNSPATFRPDMWTCVDSPSNFLASIWLDPKIQKIVPMSHVEKKLFDSSKWKDSKTTVGDCPNVVYYRRNEVVNTDEYLFEDTMNWGNHSKVGGGRSVFMVAMRLMFLMGVRRLYLLGVDFHMDKNNHYHFPQNRTKSSVSGNMSTYSSMKKWFSELKPIFDEIGFEVYNCNPDSALTVFEYRSFDSAIKDATSIIPDGEKTDGMYSRVHDNKKKAEEKQAKKIAAQFTDEQKAEIKAKLDALRAKLDDMKEAQHQVLLSKFSDFGKQCFMWAHKLKRPENPKMAEFYDNLKSLPKDGSPKFGTDVFMAKLYKTQIDIDKTRAEFRACKTEKNRMWGIV